MPAGPGGPGGTRRGALHELGVGRAGRQTLAEGVGRAGRQTRETHGCSAQHQHQALRRSSASTDLDQQGLIILGPGLVCQAPCVAQLGPQLLRQVGGIRGLQRLVRHQQHWLPAVQGLARPGVNVAPWALGTGSAPKLVLCQASREIT